MFSKATRSGEAGQRWFRPDRVISTLYSPDQASRPGSSTASTCSRRCDASARQYLAGRSRDGVATSARPATATTTEADRRAVVSVGPATRLRVGAAKRCSRARVRFVPGRVPAALRANISGPAQHRRLPPVGERRLLTRSGQSGGGSNNGTAQAAPVPFSPSWSTSHPRQPEDPTSAERRSMRRRSAVPSRALSEPIDARSLRPRIERRSNPKSSLT